MLAPQPDYMRYWHGYVVFTRPALAVFGLTGTRWLAIAILGIDGRRPLPAPWAGGSASIAADADRRAGLLTTDMIAGGWSISQAIGMADRGQPGGSCSSRRS